MQNEELKQIANTLGEIKDILRVSLAVMPYKAGMPKHEVAKRLHVEKPKVVEMLKGIKE